MHHLQNMNPVITKPGEIGSAIRLNKRWPDVSQGDVLEVRTGATPETSVLVGTGEVKDVWRGRFADVPARFVDVTAQERCRTYAGLRDVMIKAYHDQFNDDVGVVAFTFLLSEPTEAPAPALVEVATPTTDKPIDENAPDELQNH